MTEKPALDWSTAEVSDAKLTVGLSAKPRKEWRESEPSRDEELTGRFRQFAGDGADGDE